MNSHLQLNSLIHINIQDFLASFGLENLQRGRRLIEALCWLPARRFAQQMLRYDQQVAHSGLQKASTAALRGYVHGLEVLGQENIPVEGPLLVLSNHPGMTDTLILFSSLPRPDLKIVAAERPFLQALPQVSRRLISVPDAPGQRMGVVRSSIQHLRQGGAVLTFPAGEIEPDPASMPGAVESLKNWSDSIALFARMAPEARIVIAIVSGVIWPATLNHPISRLRRHQKDRERLAAALQILVQMLLPAYRPVITRVAYSPALSARDLAASHDPALILGTITAQARLLIERNLETPVMPVPQHLLLTQVD